MLSFSECSVYGKGAELKHQNLVTDNRIGENEDTSEYKSAKENSNDHH